MDTKIFFQMGLDTPNHRSNHRLRPGQSLERFALNRAGKAAIQDAAIQDNEVHWTAPHECDTVISN
jgi:hypothetical protein